MVQRAGWFRECEGRREVRRGWHRECFDSFDRTAWRCVRVIVTDQTVEEVWASLGIPDLMEAEKQDPDKELDQDPDIGASSPSEDPDKDLLDNGLDNNPDKKPEDFDKEKKAATSSRAQPSSCTNAL